MEKYVHFLEALPNFLFFFLFYFALLGLEPMNGSHSNSARAKFPCPEFFIILKLSSKYTLCQILWYAF
jgi:hypothetical protein